MTLDGESGRRYFPSQLAHVNALEQHFRRVSGAGA